MIFPGVSILLMYCLVISYDNTTLNKLLKSFLLKADP